MRRAPTTKFHCRLCGWGEACMLTAGLIVTERSFDAITHQLAWRIGVAIRRELCGRPSPVPELCCCCCALCVCVCVSMKVCYRGLDPRSSSYLLFLSPLV